MSADPTTDDAVRTGSESPDPPAESRAESSAEPSGCIEGLIEEINGQSFAAWHHEREFAQNIREGKPYFNSPGRVPAPKRHSPSQLLQCHRKILYR